MTDHPADEFKGAPFVVLGAVIAVLAFSNVMANEVIPDWLYVPWNLMIAVVLVTIALRWDHQCMETMGLARDKITSGLRLGIPVSVVIAAFYLIGVAIPWTRDLFMDERSDIPAIEMLYKVLIEIPFGTVLLEEIAFRGILPAMLRSRLRPAARQGLAADAIAACLFGLWHILPSLSLGTANDSLEIDADPLVLQIGGVVVSVLTTAVLAMVLSWTRNRTDSVAAPAALHATNNSAASLAAWLAQRVL
ncbi:MAG: lysostaphin resistance A-like protein [Microthrixaceae bacterium]